MKKQQKPSTSDCCLVDGLNEWTKSKGEMEERMRGRKERKEEKRRKETRQLNSIHETGLDPVTR